MVIKLETDIVSLQRTFSRLRDVKLCLEIECSALWSDDQLICPACGSREVALLETFINRKEETKS